MTSLSDFPPDVQAAATECADMIAASEAPGVTFRAAVEFEVARAIMADRARRIDISGLTTRQGECLRFIASHQEQHGGVTPSYREVADFLGLASVSGVVRLIDGLEDRGRIKRLPNRSRAITIIATPAS